MKEPTYDNGEYCVEFMEDGKWRKKKTGKYLSRNWNHITLRYAIQQFTEQTMLGSASRIVHERSSGVVAANQFLHQSPEWRTWKNVIDAFGEIIKDKEKDNR